MTRNAASSLIFLIALLFGAAPASGSMRRLLIFREVPAAFESATGVDSNRPDIRNFFGNRTTLFPKSGKFDEYTSQLVLSQASLASLYCDQMLETDARQPDPAARWVHGRVDFSAPPAKALSGEVRGELIESYAKLFWRRSPDDVERAILQDAFQSSIQGSPANATGTKSALLQFCSLVAGSFEFMTVQ